MPHDGGVTASEGRGHPVTIHHAKTESRLPWLIANILISSSAKIDSWEGAAASVMYMNAAERAFQDAGLPDGKPFLLSREGKMEPVPQVISEDVTSAPVKTPSEL